MTEKSPEVSTEVIDALLKDIAPLLLLAFLDTQPYGRGILRGFQQTPKTLRLAPVQARFKDVLQHHPGAAEDLITCWKLGNEKVLEKVHALSDKKLDKQLPELTEMHGERTVHLSLVLDGRNTILQQQSAAKKTEKKPASKKTTKKASQNSAAKDQAITQLNQELETQRQATDAAQSNLQDTQQKLDQVQEQSLEKQHQSDIRERELARNLKRESQRAVNAEQLLEDKTRTASRDERRLKRTSHELEEATAEVKRLRRQVRQQQRIAEDLRKQLAAITPKEIKKDIEELSPAATKTPKLRAKAPSDPADQLFQFEIAGHKFQLSARQVAIAIDRNDEELVYSLTQALFELREKNAAGHKMFIDRVRTFDRYSARVLTGDTMRVLVDASNVARFEKNKYGKGILANLLALRDELRSRSYFPITMIADASLPHFIDEPHEFKRLIQQGMIQITNKGEEADEYLTRIAQKNGAFVVTNDVNFHLKIAPHFEPLRIGFTIDHGAIYLHEF